MAMAPRREGEAEFQACILEFVRAGVAQASGSLRGRTFEQLEVLCQRHFCGAPPVIVFERIDWRVVHELFSFIWLHSTQDNRGNWKGYGEDLYRQMRYLNDGPRCCDKSYCGAILTNYS